MRIRFVLCVLAIVLFGVTACSPQSPDCIQEDVFCVGLVTDTRGLNDFGINGNTWAGLQQSHADGVIDQVAYIESVDSKDYEKNIAYFLDADYDVIVTSGIGLRDATLHSANLYPDSVFVGMNQSDDESKSNFIPVTFPEDQMGFLAGVLAARLTKLGTIGAVCETSGIDSMQRYCEGFRAGAKYTDNSVKAIIVYRDNESSSKLFIDDEWGYETAQELVSNGVDVIFAAGGETAVGALRAAGEAKIHSIGTERDQAAVLGSEGSSVLTSFLGQSSSTVIELMRTLRGGDRSGAVTGQIMHTPFNDIVSSSTQSELEELAKKLENGEIQTNVAP